jgi:dihydroneopterin aldolase
MPTLLHDPRLARCRRIFVRNWEVDANIGVHSAEREGAQPLVLNLDVYVRLDASTPRRDELAEVVDYDGLCALVRQRIALGHINLQETLVDDLAAAVLRQPGVEAVRVSSEKTEIYPQMGGIGVEVLRFKEDAA